MTDTPQKPAEAQEPATPEAPPLPWAEVQPEHFKMLRLAPCKLTAIPAAAPCASCSSVMPNAITKNTACYA